MSSSRGRWLVVIVEECACGDESRGHCGWGCWVVVGDDEGEVRELSLNRRLVIWKSYYWGA